MEEMKKEDNKKSNAAIIAVAIMFILILLGVVFWFIFKFLSPSINYSPPPKTKENQVNDNFNVNKDFGAESPTGVYLEKNEYKPGENIIGAIRNSTDYRMVVIGLAVEQFAIEPCKSDLEEKCPQSWQPIKSDLLCACGAKCERANIIISSHNSKEINWNQETDKVSLVPDSCKKAEAGRYRIRLNYYMYNDMVGANQVANNIYLYSNEFVISDNAVHQSNNN